SRYDDHVALRPFPTDALPISRHHHRLAQLNGFVVHDNAEAAALGDTVVVALPAAGLATTLPPAREAGRGKVVISTLVPLTVGGQIGRAHVWTPGTDPPRMPSS